MYGVRLHSESPFAVKQRPGEDNAGELRILQFHLIAIKKQSIVGFKVVDDRVSVTNVLLLGRVQ